jgi:thiamine biosynthesis lipoprotein
VRTGTLFALATWALLSAGSAEPVLVTRDVYLMGTRAVLSTYADSRAAGLPTLEAALATLEEAEAELSTWRPSSAISTLNRQPVGKPWLATPRVCRLFNDVSEWHRVTDGAFDPAIGRLLATWDIQGDGVVPSSASHAAAMALSGMRLFAFDAGRCTVTRQADVAMDVGAFGKGEALDRVATALGDAPWMIDLGGQVSVGGHAPPNGGWTVAVADPSRRDRATLEVRLASGSLSTSAGSERDLVVNGTRIGHVFDPRTGQSVTFEGSVTVWHERGLAADALSTALFVMGPEEGLRWSEARNLAVLYLIPERGKLRVELTRSFRSLISTDVTVPE